MLQCRDPSLQLFTSGYAHDRTASRRSRRHKMAARVSLCDTVGFMWPRTCIPVHSRWLLSHVTCVVRACVVRKRRSEGCVWVNHVVRSELLGPARDLELSRHASRLWVTRRHTLPTSSLRLLRNEQPLCLAMNPLAINGPAMARARVCGLLTSPRTTLMTSFALACCLPCTHVPTGKTSDIFLAV